MPLSKLQSCVSRFKCGFVRLGCTQCQSYCEFSSASSSLVFMTFCFMF